MSRLPKNGFTLLELLVYIGILSFVLVVIAGVFITFGQGKGKVDARAEINQNLSLIIGKIQQDLQDADSVSTPSSTNDATSSLSMDVNGTTVSYATSSDSTLFTRTSGSDTQTINSGKVKFNSFLVERLENTNYTLNQTFVTIKVIITASTNNDASEEQYSQTKQTSVVLRQN
ncbi:MAG: hypothetical protein COT81_02345 [Candidatus Buchananbacteria bacterium CG10_big_fil_rev_8_21_14_0_10_42_9]|uniref:Type II secretion system protein n=1 Tax=Candidatus Buchananbacteria bacterium CG10_big_fil_rev_8_21_14_0_10_42_9 TaxID=1974526 RepID=A0A2H0W1I9_9BACT|nr:MAG: hypothetical protein COT81_02345 [Candidatus Buchananbacteria bacterium CG10_big_fil_rev_8_21_14_0_10_42_9]